MQLSIAAVTLASDSIAAVCPKGVRGDPDDE
jgi:hypothetical protein